MYHCRWYEVLCTRTSACSRGVRMRRWWPVVALASLARRTDLLAPGPVMSDPSHKRGPPPPTQTPEKGPESSLFSPILACCSRPFMNMPTRETLDETLLCIYFQVGPGAGQVWYHHRPRVHFSSPLGGRKLRASCPGESPPSISLKLPLVKHHTTRHGTQAGNGFGSNFRQNTSPPLGPSSRPSWQHTATVAGQERGATTLHLQIQVLHGRFQALLTLPKECFAHFPRGTCVLSGFHLCI